MKQDKILIHLAHFPPPYGGVTVGNLRFYELLKKEKKQFIMFNFKDNPLNLEGIIDVPIKTQIISPLKLMKFIKYRLEIIKRYDLRIDTLSLLKYYIKAVLMAKYLDKNNSYVAYVNHLGKNQLIYIFLRLLGYNIDIHTYLHGKGILENYDKNPELYKKLTNLSDTYLVASQHMMDIYNQKKDKIDDVRLCPPFIVDTYYNYNVDKKENILLFVGSLSDVKNPMYLLDEINKTKDILRKYKLVFIGDGSLKPMMKEFILKHKLSNIEILGSLSVTDTEKYYEKSKYLILPSKREPFGRVITEAMAKGVVPIVSDRGGMKEIFSRKSGFVFKLESGSLSRILETLPDLSFEEMSLQAYNESLKYGESIAGKKWIEIIYE